MSLPLADHAAPTQCSGAGCRAPAAWAVHWRNPRIHGVERVKVWLACDAHRSALADYLGARGFPVVVTAVGVTVAAVP
ncbi:MAG: hypothetical protein HY996_10475 [Micrococcales bacterium]|nr:hypothetical protein [Micrococcales bacterium]